MNKTKRCALALIALGISVFLAPFSQGIFIEWQARQHAAASVAVWREISESEWQAQKAEAERINDRQRTESVVDPFTASDGRTRMPVVGTGSDGVFAQIHIPKIEVTQPIYLGASDEHLALGAAQVEGTALPIGGSGTRSVIAGHRGFRGIPYFRDLDKLEAGDEIRIDLPRETLTYLVTDTQVIAPSDSDALAPIEGEDRITLLTCTPYRVNTDRLLVNAIRKEKEDPSKTETQPAETSETEVEPLSVPSGWHAFSPHRQRIVLSVGGGWLVVVGLVIKIIRFRR